MNKNTCQKPGINMDTIIRKIIGVKKNIPFAKLPHQDRKNYWNVATAFRTKNSFGGMSAYKTGKGMKLIYDFVTSK